MEGFARTGIHGGPAPAQPGTGATWPRLFVRRHLAKTLNCEAPPRRNAAGVALDSCDRCLSCQKIDQTNHPDVQWIRPESKSRIITIDQMRELMQTVNFKPTHSPWKVAIIVAADRLNEQAANAFLKTLEEPPGDSVLALLSTDPQRVLETIRSRCLRISFPGESRLAEDPALLEWLGTFSQLAAGGAQSLLRRYRLLSVFLSRLNQLKSAITENLTRHSPLEEYEDVESRLRDKWEEELSAAIEAEYRHQRQQMLVGLQWWFRDVWLAASGMSPDLFAFPQLANDVQAVANRLTPRQAMANLEQLEQTQRLLTSNVQEALALEVGLLKLKL
jgi:DNA polymerase-3 subunit delta'